jgi:hypothetical protein
MGEAADGELARFEKGRTVWLLEPDVDPFRLVPYAPRGPDRGAGRAAGP